MVSCMFCFAHNIISLFCKSAFGESVFASSNNTTSCGFILKDRRFNSNLNLESKR